MYHNIAIIQNEKELFKYSFADWKSIFSSSRELASYKCKFFDEHNITALFEIDNLDYDAIFFAMNALDAKEIYDACIHYKEQISRFLDDGNGLFIGYSSKQNSRDFLPDKYHIRQAGRDMLSETQNDGDLMLCPESNISHMMSNQCLEEYSKRATVYVGHAINTDITTSENFDYLWLLHEFFTTESGIAQIVIGVGAIVVEISLFMIFFFKDRRRNNRKKRHKGDEDG